VIDLKGMVPLCGFGLADNRHVLILGSTHTVTDDLNSKIAEWTDEGRRQLLARGVEADESVRMAVHSVLDDGHRVAWDLAFRPWLRRPRRDHTGGGFATMRLPSREAVDRRPNRFLSMPWRRAGWPPQPLSTRPVADRFRDLMPRAERQTLAAARSIRRTTNMDETGQSMSDLSGPGMNNVSRCQIV
jgi:hypothetical protein